MPNTQGYRRGHLESCLKENREVTAKKRVQGLERIQGSGSLGMAGSQGAWEGIGVNQQTAVGPRGDWGAGWGSGIRCKRQRSREAACSRPRLIALWWLGAKSLTLSLGLRSYIQQERIQGLKYAPSILGPHSGGELRAEQRH